jgi:Plant transposon protein
MAAAGFHGCVASTDATHVTMMRCPVSRANEHRGPKESLPARTYNISVNNQRKILYTTKGHPARWNGKTLCHYYEFLKSVKDERILDDMRFSLFERSVDGSIVEKNYLGCWIMCNIGYLNWSCLVSPIKDPIEFKEKLWSEWLESMQKDFECTFGIMKGLFGILKTGIKLHKIKSVDELWCTCCALHNIFLDDDGLNDAWEQGAQSEWEGELGEQEDGLDYSGIGLGNDVVIDNEDQTEVDIDPNEATVIDGVHVTRVRNCSHKCFKQKLINHFEILYEKKEVKWPKRNRLIFSFLLSWMFPPVSKIVIRSFSWTKGPYKQKENHPVKNQPIGRVFIG